MEKLWSPWRSKYIESFKPGTEKKDGCLFCRVITENKDKENYVVHRGKKAFIIMNLYPYNSGHLMAAPYKHCSKLGELNEDEMAECNALINKGCKILDETLSPHGYNIGMNIGRAAGAGIEDHIHYHIVPRWNGDTNFMPVLNEVKVVSQMMDEIYEKLKKAAEKFA